jgi:hypothetical protein
MPNAEEASPFVGVDRRHDDHGEVDEREGMIAAQPRDQSAKAVWTTTSVTTWKSEPGAPRGRSAIEGRGGAPGSGAATGG